MDFKKFLYEKKKQEKEAKKKQVVQKTKEVKFHVNIDKHDYEFKLKNAMKFLGQGNKLKITIQYRGREMAHKDLGEALMKNIVEFLKEEAVIEMRPKLQGRNYTMIMAPLATRKS